MDFSDFFGPQPNVLKLRGETRWQAIDELINHLAALGKIESKHLEEILRIVRKRESAMTTGIGFGIAIPHACTPFVDEVVGAVGRSRKGIRFDSLDGKPVDLVFLFLVPQGQFQKHLNVLANLAKQLHSEELRKEFRRRFGGNDEGGS